MSAKGIVPDGFSQRDSFGASELWKKGSSIGMPLAPAKEDGMPSTKEFIKLEKQ
jgi:hypothetical protein